MTAADVRQAYVVLEKHRSAGNWAMPLCRQCGQPWPCLKRIAAHAAIAGIVNEAWREAVTP